MKLWYDTKIKFGMDSMSDYGQAKIHELRAERNRDDLPPGQVATFHEPHTKGQANLLTDEYVKYIEECTGLTVRGVRIFSRKAGDPGPGQNGAHLDYNHVTGKLSYLSLNWITCNDNQTDEMVWYSNDIPFSEDNMDKQFPLSEITELGAANITGAPDTLSMPRVDILHGIRNVDTDRDAICVRFENEFNSWEEVIAHFKSKGLLVEE